MISQSIGWKPTTLPLQIDGYLAWFYTDDYNSRVSSYEKNILYAFNMPFFMGMGCGLPLPFVWIFGNVYPCLRNWLTPIIGTGI